MKKRLILTAHYFSIEPLGILYLAGVAKKMGWECKVILTRDFDFKTLYDEILKWKPHLVGFQIWTGGHLQAFKACDEVRKMGIPVVIGGPHATYFDRECNLHADSVMKGGAFGLFEQMLNDVLLTGVHFNQAGREEDFPFPDRQAVYDVYPEFAASPIKSIIASVGCPFTCTYCYAPAFNEMHGGFSLTMRSVCEVTEEAKDILTSWPLSMIYFQDDIFGYNLEWLEEFAKLWKDEVGVAFHCQLRLELVRGDSGSQRLDLLVRAGCSGITLAIESGNEFLRDYVLFRHMNDELIIEGCKKIMSRGMTLRTEQILAVPFSDIPTELSTLRINSEINPTMTWTSILSPFGGTDMGIISNNFSIYEGNNDDLSETFFNRSVLKHIDGGPCDIKKIIANQGFARKDCPLLKMSAKRNPGSNVSVFLDNKQVGEITYLNDEENGRYCDDTVRLHQFFMWLANVPNSEVLGKKFLAVSKDKWNWSNIGSISEKHLSLYVGEDRLESWKLQLAHEMDCNLDNFPPFIAENPWFFIFFPEGGTLANKAIKNGIFENTNVVDMLEELATLSRRHLFHYGLYKIETGRDPIAV